MTTGAMTKTDKLEQESMGFKEIVTIFGKTKRCPVFDDDRQYVVYDHEKG